MEILEKVVDLGKPFQSLLYSRDHSVARGPVFGEKLVIKY